MKKSIVDWTVQCHSQSRNAGWWDGIDLDQITPTKLCLIHSEISEALEGFRKDLMDDKLPHRKMAEVELADAVIRILDLAGAHEMDIEGAMKEKLEYNLNREDHKQEIRRREYGKKY